MNYYIILDTTNCIILQKKTGWRLKQTHCLDFGISENVKPLKHIETSINGGFP
jgi:hypothetical protein